MPHLIDRITAALADRYAIESELGRGGMAIVYRARDLRHDRTVAVKVLLPDLASAVGGERFSREIDIAAKLSHPHILPLLESGQADGLVYYVMPFAEGETLGDRMDRETQLPLEDVVEITRHVAAGLAYAHSRGVVHRDVKPANILLTAGIAVVADFGVARALTTVGEEAITSTGIAVGTPAYMSPEQAGGDPKVDGRSDVYSLAAVVYEMLGGEVPYSGATPQAIRTRQLEGDPRPLSSIRNTVSPKLDAVIRKALSPSPADRFVTAAQFAEAIDAAAKPERPATEPSVRAVSVAPKRWLPAVVGALVIAALGTGWWVLRPTAAARVPAASLVVFPFRGTGADGEALGTGVADLLAAAVDGTVGIRVADPASVWRSLQGEESSTLRAPDLDEARNLAARYSASTLVLGSVTPAGERVAVTARVYDRDGRLRSTLTAQAHADSLGPALDRLAIGLVSSVWERDTLPTVPVIEDLATTSVNALKAYLEAKSLAYRGEFDAAEGAIERAVALDSTFALAHLEQFRIRSWNLYTNGLPYVGLTPIINRALAHQDRLSPRNRLRVQGYKALDNTDGAQAAVAFERILQIDEQDLDALVSLAFTGLSYGWQLDQTADEVAALYDRVLALDSTHLFANAARTWVALWTQDRDDVDRAIARLEQTDTTNLVIRGTMAAARVMASTGERQDSILDVLTTQPVPVVTGAFRILRSADPAVTERLLRKLDSDSMDTTHRLLAVRGLAQLWFAEGRTRAVDSLYQTGALDDRVMEINRYFVTSYLAGYGDSAVAARAVRELTAFAPADSLGAYLYSKPAVWASGWAVGAYHASLGQFEEADEWSRALGALPQGDTFWNWRTSLTADIAARVAARRGDLETAEVEARRAYRDWTIHSMNVTEGFPEPAIRFHLAEILYANGASNEAQRLYTSFGPPHNWAGFYAVLSALRLGRIAEDAEDFAEAAFRYGFALALLERGGSAVADWRRVAEDGLARATDRIG